MPLFRKEVAEARRALPYGPIALAQPWSAGRFAAGAAISLAAIILYLALGSYTRRVTVNGVLFPEQGATRIFAQANGSVTQVLVQPGQVVSATEPMFILSNDRRSSLAEDGLTLRDAKESNLSARTASLVTSRQSIALIREQSMSAIRSRIDSLKDRLSQVIQEVDIQTARVSAAETVVQKYAVLAREHYVSELSLREKQDQLNIASSQLLATTSNRIEIKESIAAAEAQLKETHARTAIQFAEINRDLANIDQERAEVAALSNQVVAAPFRGIVAAINAQVGQQSGPQPLAVLLPASAPLQARLYAPSKAIGFVRVGQRVRMRYHAFPYQKFGQKSGIVKGISLVPLTPNELLLAPSPVLAASEPMYRIDVALDAQEVAAYGTSTALLAGMLLEADIEQDRRRFIEWLREPIAAFVRQTT